MNRTIKTDVPKPGPDVPKLQIDCYGKYCSVYAGNLLIGKGVKSVVFRQEAEKPATITLECDVEQLGFSIVEENESAPDAAPSGAEMRD